MGKFRDTYNSFDTLWSAQVIKNAQANLNSQNEYNRIAAKTILEAARKDLGLAITFVNDSDAISEEEKTEKWQVLNDLRQLDNNLGMSLAQLQQSLQGMQEQEDDEDDAVTPASHLVSPAATSATLSRQDAPPSAQYAVSIVEDYTEYGDDAQDEPDDDLQVELNEYRDALNSDLNNIDPPPLDIYQSAQKAFSLYEVSINKHKEKLKELDKQIGLLNGRLNADGPPISERTRADIERQIEALEAQKERVAGRLNDIAQKACDLAKEYRDTANYDKFSGLKQSKSLGATFKECWGKIRGLCVAVGAIVGAVIGFLVGGPVGLVVGAALGAALGKGIQKAGDNLAEKGWNGVKREASNCCNVVVFSGFGTMSRKFAAAISNGPPSPAIGAGAQQGRPQAAAARAALTSSDFSRVTVAPSVAVLSAPPASHAPGDDRRPPSERSPGAA